jgi:hypothetical protein
MEHLIGELTRLAQMLEKGEADMNEPATRKAAAEIMRAAVEVLLEQERAA